MNGKTMAAILVVLVLLAVGLLTAPVFSGEHPWDSDRSGGGSGGTTGGTTTVDTSAVKDTAVVAAATTPTSSGRRVGWYRVMRAVWSATMAI